MDEKKIEDFARWMNSNSPVALPLSARLYIAREAARRFGMSAEDWAVLDAAEQYAERWGHQSINMMDKTHCDLMAAVLARRKSLDPKPRYYVKPEDMDELGIHNDVMERHGSPPADGRVARCAVESDAKRIAALLNQAHETERG